MGLFHDFREYLGWKGEFRLEKRIYVGKDLQGHGGRPLTQLGHGRQGTVHNLAIITLIKKGFKATNEIKMSLQEPAHLFEALNLFSLNGKLIYP